MINENSEDLLARHARAKRSNALEAGMQLAQEALGALEDSSWDKATALGTAALVQFAFASTPVLEYDMDVEMD